MKTRVQGVRRSLVGGSLWSLLFLLPAIAPADWLVLQTGERIETKGAWTVKGKQVVYTTPEKLLRSLRLSEVNLEASTQASAVEPASKKKLYVDMGEAPDVANVKPPAEFNILNAWIANPNAPRVSGSVSSPTLRASETDLTREGMRILQDPGAVQDELMQEAEQIDAQYARCVEVNSKLGQSGQCSEDYSRSKTALTERVREIYAAVNTVRRQQQTEAQMLAEDAAETRRIDQERAAEEAEAKRLEEEAARKHESPPR
ncbi:MAG: hypothetical protein KBF21_11560 [Thermoanaerobaculia bacterium]|jgi:hypothetical protein|nr:hypothetical protein [Thermoanaerobaculia bacterium]MBP9824850.1 hypothetical protein [Thermoanaerobaculia bacterium]